MKTIIYYYTGTGNSLSTARTLASELGNAECVTISPLIGLNAPVSTDAQTIGFVFPVHIWGVPRAVLSFLKLIPSDSTKYYFALAVNGGQVAATLLQLEKVMKSSGLTLSAGFDLKFPSNYIPWGGPVPPDEQQQLFSNAKEKIKKIAYSINSKEKLPIEKGPLWQNILFSWFYKMSFNQVHYMDKKFWVDDKCNHCGICEKVCPCGNIEMDAGKPRWKNSCEQCLACIQWCPQKAIQYGKKTPAYERYHHPEIKLRDMIREELP